MYVGTGLSFVARMFIGERTNSRLSFVGSAQARITLDDRRKWEMSQRFESVAAGFGELSIVGGANGHASFPHCGAVGVAGGGG